MQHFGYGSKDTAGLKLAHWATLIELQLEFNYTWIHKDYVNLTELLESALADKIKPLLGKKA